MSFEKAKELFKQASRDLEISCFDKVVSAAYFSARMFAEVFLAGRKLKIPRRDDKLANLLRRQGFTEEAEILLQLYVWRKESDYGPILTEEERATKALDLARKIIISLEKECTKNKKAAIRNS